METCLDLDYVARAEDGSPLTLPSGAVVPLHLHLLDSEERARRRRVIAAARLDAERVWRESRPPWNPDAPAPAHVPVEEHIAAQVAADRAWLEGLPPSWREEHERQEVERERERVLAGRAARLDPFRATLDPDDAEHVAWLAIFPEGDDMDETYLDPDEAYLTTLRAQEEAEQYEYALSLDAPADRDTAYPMLNVIDLAASWEDNTEPEMLVPGVLVKGAHHTVYGAPEAGKTMWALAAIVKPALEAGLTVVYIDKEMSRRDILDRLKSLGVERHIIGEHFVYLELPTLDRSKDSRSQWQALLLHVEPAIVIADAQAGVLADADLNENSTSDVLRWNADYFEPARRAGAATVMLDHTGHGNPERERGASGKRALAKIAYLIETLVPFGRETVGKVQVTKTKDSLSTDVPVERVWELGGSPEGFAFTESADLFHAPREAADSALRDRVEQAVIGAGPEGLNRRALVAVVGGNESAVVDMAKYLVLVPDSPVQVRPGPRNSTIYYVTAAD